jgi:hypothetical protein
MMEKSLNVKEPAEKAIRDIRRRTRKQYSAEEKIRIVLSGLRGEEPELSPRELAVKFTDTKGYINP